MTREDEIATPSARNDKERSAIYFRPFPSRERLGEGCLISKTGAFPGYVHQRSLMPFAG